MTPPPCPEASAPAELDEATRVARWLSAELGRLHLEREAASRDAAALAELLAGFALAAEGRLSVNDGARLRGIRARADELAARLAAPSRPR